MPSHLQHSGGTCPLPAFNPKSGFVQSRVGVLVLHPSPESLWCLTLSALSTLRWYAIRLRVQPCAANNDLRITTNAQQAGRAGQNKPEVSYPSQTDELHSEIFLVRFIQQEISLDHTVTLSVEQVADQVVNGFNQRGVLARVGASIPTTCTSTVFAAR
ncbi:hypothetical protein ABBQ38_004874 [Trebouxia sp. C0009 RCD-2024]